MTDMDTQHLVAEYVRTGSERAFRELVSRYVGLVYSTASRLADGNSHLAEDIVQTVFVDLARNAGRLSGNVMLGGWLHRHTCFVAANAFRAEARRQSREQRAMEMLSLNEPSHGSFAELGALLDSAIDHLPERDRQAILLRFYEQRDFRGVGKALGIGEDASRMRVNRALEKLQIHLKSLGIGSTTTALGNTLTTQVLIAVPAGLALGISMRALAAVAGLKYAGVAGPAWLRWLSSGPAKVGGAVAASALVGWLAANQLMSPTPPPALPPVVIQPTASAHVPTPPPWHVQAISQNFAPTMPPALPQAVAPAAASTPRNTPAISPADPIEVYAILTGRTVLHGSLPPLPATLASEMQANTNDAPELLTRELSHLGYGLVLDGEKFTQIISNALIHEPRFKPLPANPPLRNDEAAATNSLHFQAVDLNTFLDIYGGVTGRTLLRSPATGNPMVSLETQTPLTRAELVHAMDTVLYLNGISTLADGGKFIQVLPNSQAQFARTNAPAVRLGEQLIAPNSVPGFGSENILVRDLAAYLSKLADETIQPSSRFDKQTMYFKPLTPMTRAELEYAIETTLDLNGLRLVRSSDGRIRLQISSHRGAGVNLTDNSK